MTLLTICLVRAAADNAGRELARLLEPARGLTPPGKGKLTDRVVRLPGVRNLLVRIALDSSFRKLLGQQLADGTIDDAGRAFYALWALDDVSYPLTTRQYRQIIERHPGTPVAYLALLISPAGLDGMDTVDHRKGLEEQVERARRWREGELVDVPGGREFRGDRRFLATLLSGLEQYPPPPDRTERDEYEDAIGKLSGAFEDVPETAVQALIDAYPGHSSLETIAILFSMAAYLDLHPDPDHRNAAPPAEVQRSRRRMLALFEQDLRAGEDRGEFRFMVKLLMLGTAAQRQLGEELWRKRFGKGMPKLGPLRAPEGQWGVPLPEKYRRGRSAKQSSPARPSPAQKAADARPTAKTDRAAQEESEALRREGKGQKLPRAAREAPGIVWPILLALAGCLLVAWLIRRAR